MKREAAALVSLLLSLRATADEPKTLLPCRPTIACTAELAPAGTLQLEAGYLRRGLGPGVTQQSAPFLLKLALLDWLESQLGSNGFTFANGAAPSRYHDDLQGGLKARLLEGAGALPTLGVSALLSVPTPGRQPGYVKTTDLLFTGYLTSLLPLAIEADLNAGANVLHIEGAAQVQPWAALALSRNLPLELTAMIEGYHFAASEPFAYRDAGVLLAISWSAFTWLTLDVGGDAGLFPQNRRFSLFAGVSLGSGRLWSRE